MNERIKQLAIQAGRDDSDGYPVLLEWSSRFAEKFAELIVRECMSYMKDGDIDFAKFMIKRNFGVEE